jgi:hypothetical protein
VVRVVRSSEKAPQGSTAGALPTKGLCWCKTRSLTIHAAVLSPSDAKAGCAWVQTKKRKISRDDVTRGTKRAGWCTNLQFGSGSPKQQTVHVKGYL